MIGSISFSISVIESVCLKKIKNYVLHVTEKIRVLYLLTLLARRKE